MGTITAGVGLISGLDYQSLIDQLMTIEQRPRDQLLTRVSNIDAQKAAYLSISARISALLTRVDLLTRAGSFQASKTTSSLPDVLSATAGTGAQPGSYSFVVRALASTQQLVSRGYYDPAAPLNGGTITIESADARVNNGTRLDELNGHTGVRRGSFKISNGTQQATVNISDALTIGDVLTKINAAGIQVTAKVVGDGLVLTDTSGTGGLVHVQEVDGGQAAADLGFGSGHNSAAGGELTGSAVMFLAESTPVSSLNDGLGLRTALAGGDFTIDAGGKSISVSMSEILAQSTRLGRLNHGQGVRLGKVKLTSKDGTTATVDLSAAKTIDDVNTALKAAFGDSRISVVVTGSRLVVNDNTDVSKLSDDQKRDFTIEDVTGYAARDLGINGTSSAGKINGRDVLHMDTLADAITAINFAIGNEDDAGAPIVTALTSADKLGLTLSTASGPMVLTGAGADARSKALFDLGFKEGTYEDTGSGAQAVGSRIVGGIDTVMLKTLNGGSGFTGSTLQIDANGQSVSIDVSGARTLADVIGLINQATNNDGSGLGVEAAYDSTGTHLVVSNLVDESALTISGDFAESIGLAQTGTSIKSDNLQKQYISEATQLAKLNAGRGIARGRFTLTNSRGVSATVDLSSSSVVTVQDVIDAIKHLNIGVTASINATGDGLLLTDASGGAGTMEIKEDGGSTAHDLNILGSAKNGKIDGSFEFKLAISGSDTLTSLAARIGSETTLATATLLNDGTQLAPYRLSIASQTSGKAGELIIDDGETGLGVTTLVPASDARLLFGGSNAAGMLLTSSTNTFAGVISGLTFTANAVDDRPVTVTVNRDLDSLVAAVQGLVTDFNSAVDAVKQAGAYDADTQTPGVLEGEGTLNTVQNRLQSLVSNTVFAGGPFTRLSQVGITTENQGHLSFDEEKFRAAYATNPQALERFFTDEKYGVAVQIKTQIDQMSGTDGLISKATGTLTTQTDLLQERVTTLNEQLDRKRARLLTQFQAMEAALSQLQSQSAALTSLSQLADTYATTKSGSSSSK